MKAVVAAFNQEKALVGAFSVITNLRMGFFEALEQTRGGVWENLASHQCKDSSLDAVDWAIFTRDGQTQGSSAWDGICQNTFTLVTIRTISWPILWGKWKLENNWWRNTHTPPRYSRSVTARVALSNRTENTTTTTSSWAEQRNRDNYTKDQRAQSLMLKFLSFHLIRVSKRRTI